VFQLLSSPEAGVWGTGGAEPGEKKRDPEHSVGGWGCLGFGEGGKEQADPHLQP